MNKTMLARAILYLCFALFSTVAMAQNKQITGKVTDSKDGSPLQSVSVVVKGTKIGTQTEADGSFKLSVPANATTLVVSSTGFESQNVSISGKSSITISLVSANEQLNDVVVIGYGTAKKKDVTSSVVSVKAKDFNAGVITSPDQLIQGKVAGLQVVTNSGAPGAASTIRIRGNSSVRSNNNPLFVIDGIPLDGRVARPDLAPAGIGNSPGSNPMYFYNPNDIASISVLKDASATAIYGSRGANGVIEITSKRGAVGAAKVDFNASTGISSIFRKYSILNGDEYRAALKSYGLTGGDFGSNVDAMDAITRTGITQNYNVGISGGTDNGKYRMSVGYMDQQGILKKSNLKKYTFNLNGQYKFLENKRLSLDFNVLASHNKENIVGVTNDGGFQGSLVGMALMWNPTQSLYKNDGSLNIIPGSSIVNPLAMSNGYDDVANITNLFATIGAGYKLSDNLDYRFNVSINHQSGIRTAQEAKYITIPEIEGRGFASYATAQLTSLVLQHTLNYNKRLSKDVDFGALLGYEYQNFAYKGSAMSAQDFTTDIVSFTNIMQNSSAASRRISSFEDPSSSLQSYFTRLRFSILDKYVIQGTMRADGSSKFGANNKYGYFPSVSASWALNKESFLKDVKDINNLKLRVSYGITGNQSFPAGSAQSQYSFGQGSISLANVANPDLKWESTKQFDLGVDFDLFGGKVYGSVDYFSRNTTNILFRFDAIQPAPATKYWINLPGNIMNNGVELSLGTALIRKKDLNWNLSVNTAFLKNELKNYNGPAVLTGAISGQGLSGASIQRLASNQPLNAFYLKRFEGLDASGNSVYSDKGNTLYYIGNPNPKQLLGISTDVTIKKLTITANFNGAFGHDIYNNTLNGVLPINNLGSRNFAKSLIGNKESLANPISTSSRYLEKGDYLKMTNLSVAYRLGNIGKTIKNANLFLTGQNLFVITKYTGFDPEVNTDKGIDGVPSFGIEYIPYPSPRSFVLGFNFNL